LARAGAPKRVEQGYFSQLLFLLRHHARSLASEKAAFWNSLQIFKVGRNLAYGVGTAGAPNRVKQRFCCTKSAKSAPILQSLYLAHFVQTI
jgi:hypothetical protein